MATTAKLSAGIGGLVLQPGDPEWNRARRAFNLAVDQRPASVAFPADEDDVVALVTLARDHGMQIAPQTTAHNAGPLGSLQDTMLLNTSRLAGELGIDERGRCVRVSAATRWAHVIGPLSKLGLAALHGSSPDVGVVGYSLGGGMGWLARELGLQSNSVTAVELVNARGELMRCDATHDPELFWALRGGGGNFGVVTAIEFRAHPVEQLYAGAMMFPFSSASEVVSLWNELLTGWPDELTSWAVLLHLPDLPFVPEPLRGGSFAAILGAFLGDEAEGRGLLAPFRGLGPIMDTFAIAPPAALAELAMDPPDPLPYLSAHQLIDVLTPATIERVVCEAGRGSGIAVLQLRHTGGAVARVPSGAGARANLPGSIATFTLGLTPDERSTATVSRSLQAVQDAFGDHGVGRYPSFVEEPADARSLFDTATLARLRDVKRRHDPDDVFRANHHFSPAP